MRIIRKIEIILFFILKKKGNLKYNKIKERGDGMNRRLLKNQAKEILKTNYWKILITIVLVDILSFNFVSIESQTNSQEIYLKIFNEQILLTITPFIISVLIIVFVASLLYTVLFVSVFKYGLVNKLKHIALGDGDQYDIFDGFRNN